MKSKVKIINKPEKALKAIEKLAATMKKGGSGVKVGLPKGANDYPDGTSVVMVGAVHEFGSPGRGIPQRSYLRTGINENKRKYKELIKKLAKKVVDGKLTKKQALGLLGLQVQTDVRDKITEIRTPPLKDRSGNPLIDTGHLRQSINFEVDD